MVDARNIAQWDQTASIVAMLYNINRKKGTKALTFMDLNPCRKKKKNVHSANDPVVRDNVRSLIFAMNGKNADEYYGRFENRVAGNQ